VKGPHFIGLHELFDQIDEVVESYVDLIAERLVQLGGNGLGWSWLFPPHYAQFSIRAMEPTKTIFFYGTRLRQQCEADHDFGYEIMKRFAAVVIKNLKGIQQNLVECAKTKDIEAKNKLYEIFSSAMNGILEFLVRHGAVVLFAAAFVEQIGAPLPAAPWLLAAGVLAAAGKMNWLLALGAAAFGSLLADLIWFYLGRNYGNRVLGFLCRISLEPDSCARRTHNLFTRYGMRGIFVAKFIPGLNTLAPPLAGNSGVSARRFLLFDGLSSILYEGCFILLGVLFSRQLEQVFVALNGLGRSAFCVLVGAAAFYIGYKYYKRRRLLNDLRMARITVDELNQKLEAGEKPVILDLRSRAELEQNPSMIRGARHTTVDEIERRQKEEIPRDRDIILYCSCPNEVSSARMALLLRRKGILRVRPLLGGIDAWRERNYPTEPEAIGVASPPITNFMNEGTKP
jgi:membrane protein DedA with SNARE-associated domain/rhodanese-related sulfurtransferase